MIAQSAGIVEYLDSISANEFSRYDTKQSDGETPVMLEFGEYGVSLHWHRSQVHSGAGEG